MSATNKIRVLVLHEDPVARTGLSAAFRTYWDLEVVSTAEEPGNVLSLISELSRYPADVVVANYELGVELTRQEARHSGIAGPFKIVIVTSRDRECEIRSAIERGVRGYLLVGCSLDELATAVRTVHGGTRHLSPQVAQRLADSVSRELLTGREEEVLRLVVEGMGNKLIARRLGIAVGTVKSHLKGIFDKLDVESRTQAICSAERRGLLQEIPPARPWIGTPAGSAAAVPLSLTNPVRTIDQHV